MKLIITAIVFASTAQNEKKKIVAKKLICRNVGSHWIVC